MITTAAFEETWEGSRGREGCKILYAFLDKNQYGAREEVCLHS